MLVFDASSVIYAWDNYPLRKFPPLWNWMASQVEDAEFVVPKVAFEEVRLKAPECAKWFADKGIRRIDVSNEIAQDAIRIKGVLGIVDDKHHVNGVDENDVLIIATTRCLQCELVSNEARQPLLPQWKARFKIPAVCDLDDVGVVCLSFLDLINRSDVVFG